MPLEAAKCPSCDANIEVPADRETVYCAYCGSAIKSKAAIAYGNTVTIEGEVKVEGIATLEKLVQNAETYMKLNEYQKAHEVFTQITKEYPEDYRGWLGVFTTNMKTCFFINDDRFGYIDFNYNASEKAYNNAYKLLNTQEIKKQVEKIYEYEWTNVLHEIANGECNEDQTKNFFVGILLLYKKDSIYLDKNNLLNDLSNNQLKVANKYIKEFLLKAYNNAKYFGRTEYDGLLFQFSKIFINYKVYMQPYMPFGYAHPLDKIIISSQINDKYITDKDIKDRFLNKLCVYCGGKYNIFGTCKECGREKPNIKEQ